MSKFVRFVVSLVFMLVLFSAAPVLAQGEFPAEESVAFDWAALWGTVWPIALFFVLIPLGGQFGTELSKDLFRRITKGRKFLEWFYPVKGKSALLALIVAFVLQHELGINLFTGIDLSQYVELDLVNAFTKVLSVVTIWIAEMGWDKSKLPAKLFEATPVK